MNIMKLSLKNTHVWLDKCIKYNSNVFLMKTTLIVNCELSLLILISVEISKITREHFKRAFIITFKVYYTYS